MEHFFRKGNTLIWKDKAETIQIEPWGTDSVRVRASLTGLRDDLPGALLPQPDLPASIEIEADSARLTNGRMLVEITRPVPLSVEGRLRFLDAATGKELLAERALHFMSPREHYYKAIGGDLFHIEARFKAYPDERIFGLGQHQHGLLNQKGCVIPLLHRNANVSIPFYVSSRGYGFLWHNPSTGRVELGASGTCWVAEGAQQIDYWVTAGETPAEILQHYAQATGFPPEFPQWASGFWQSKLRYADRDELMAVAEEYHRRGLPLSVIVIDGMPWTLMGDWNLDLERWPDPAEMMAGLQDMGVQVMVSIWPTVNPLSDSFQEMASHGWLVRTERGIGPQVIFQDNQPSGPVCLYFYDATHPEARQYLWEKVRRGYYQNGIKIFWLDACEPEIYPMHPENLRYYLGNGLEVSNLYPLLHAKGFYEGMRQAGENEILTLCRSAWAGSQRYGAAVWSGDIASTFEALQIQVRAGLNMAMSGIPWWTTDTGGFFQGDPQTSYFRELIVRWYQYSVFCPILRTHGVRLPDKDGSGAPNEVWSFGEEAYGIIREQLFLRERLRPYVMSLMRTAQQTGLPPIRPMFLEFPGDEVCFELDDQYMFGPDLLVAPILQRGQRERQVYLPQGSRWTDAWTGQIYPGGQPLNCQAPLEHIPVFLRDGAELPIMNSQED
jgi:alpha-D-xyloside xylohydrolase